MRGRGAGSLGVGLCVALLAATPARADAPRKPLGTSILEAASRPAFGDLPEIRDRGALRVLVPYGLTTFYFRQGNPQGVEFDAMTELERRLRPKGKRRGSGAPLRVVFIPTPFDRLLPDLLAGRGDVAASLLTVTPERAALVDFSRPYFRDVASVVVSHAGAAPVTEPDDLSGRTVHVPAGSSTVPLLRALSDALAARGRPGVQVVELPGATWEDLLQMAAAGTVEHTVADDALARLWTRAVPGLRLEAGARLREGADIAWAVRKGSPQLLAALDDLAVHRGSRSHAGVAESVRRHMRDPGRLQRALSPGALARQREIEPLLREAGGRYGFDWLFLAALAFRESAFDAGARNPSGAVGLFQVKPETGAWVGYPDVSGPRESALAGAAYLARLRGDYYDDERLPMNVRLHFTLAAYNAGPGRVAGLRRKAAARGLDPDLWFDNVELVALDTIGHETADYVASIVRTYLAYRLAADRERVQPVPGGK